MKLEAGESYQIPEGARLEQVVNRDILAELRAIGGQTEPKPVCAIAT